MIRRLAESVLAAAGGVALAAVTIMHTARRKDTALADTDDPVAVDVYVNGRFRERAYTADKLRRLAREAEQTPGSQTSNSIAEWLRWHANLERQPPADTPLASRRDRRILTAGPDRAFRHAMGHREA